LNETLFESEHLTPRALEWYVDGILGVKEREKAARHLESCPMCREWKEVVDCQRQTGF
jgi:anti-sigma factor RsiW